MERLKHIVEINILLGAWLIAAPFVLGYTSSRMEMGNDVVLGVVLIGCSWWILAGMAGQIGFSALQLLVGLWLVAAPFVRHYGQLTRPYNNDIIVGIVSVLVSATSTWLLNARVSTAA